MVNYQNGVIYKLVPKNVNVNEIYIGSTTNFNRRKNQHKSCCMVENDKSHNLKVYQTIRSNGGFTAWEMIMIELYPCENKRELEARERYWKEQMLDSCGMRMPSTVAVCIDVNNPETIREWRKEYNSEYYQQPEVKEHRKEYYQRPEVKERSKEHRKEYRNRPEVKEHRKEYLSRPEVKERKNQRVVCNICGSSLSISNITKHQKSQKCQSAKSNI
jgi:predicted GIY-YIG superfamily endonuclease